MAGRPTIYDVAERAGVSKSLVSLVLNRSPSVSEASRLAVEEAIAALGYRPSRAAANLAARSTRLVGVLIDDYTNLWFVDLVRGLRTTLGEHGYRVTVADMATAPPTENPVEGFLSMRVEGVVVAMDVPAALSDPAAPPVVIAGTRRAAPPDADSVTNDDAVGARLAAEHLLSLGHRRLGHLTASGGAAVVRRASFVEAVERSGATVVTIEHDGPTDEQAGFDGAIALLETHPETTAIFAANDLMALGALGAARQLRRRVPEDLSIMGYDNTPLARTRLVDLTTIDDNSFAVGIEAGRLLLDRMNDADARTGARAGATSDGHARATHRTLEPDLILRGTTGPAPAAAP